MKLILIAMSYFIFQPLLASDAQSKRENLAEKIRFWSEYGHRCPEYGFPAKEANEDVCDDGDGVIFNGLLCYSGVQEGCKMVGDAQNFKNVSSNDSNYGRWWRSSRRKDNPETRRNETTDFSRDQAIGVYFYLIDLYRRNPEEAKARLEAWVSWIKNNNNALCKKNLLTCKLTPLNWSFLGRLYEKFGMPLKQVMLHRENYHIENNWITLQIIKRARGYEVHNYAATALAIDAIGHAGGKKEWLEILNNIKEMKDNPFLNFAERKICKGRCGNPDYNSISKKIIELCPTESSSAPKNQWAWERKTSEQAWNNSMGWDCVFLGKMILKENW